MMTFPLPWMGRLEVKQEIHGSNVLVPSGLTGVTVDLIFDDRWDNFIQHILYQEIDLSLPPINAPSCQLKLSFKSQQRLLQA
jgi:hypothetical protein